MYEDYVIVIDIQERKAKWVNHFDGNWIFVSVRNVSFAYDSEWTIGQPGLLINVCLWITNDEWNDNQQKMVNIG